MCNVQQKVIVINNTFSVSLLFPGPAFNPVSVMRGKAVIDDECLYLVSMAFHFQNSRIK